ncbi:molybdate ABC transporter substrate-binding protein [Paracoccus aerodenitrificans]|uniref:molybdate ABC transporter substrate-binding protein n=1 Tax=Paracoccus aerodenitrificans TaxID=3017781 RepID=UPI0022F0533B|nr:molybdate ABC transporter substrate-binding protein [Paracoccus aerodenitrificans]WBU65410.1 molybdate ABC transporter substrate-binding protein [Paracoccus aerodenitrificans]
MRMTVLAASLAAATLPAAAEDVSVFAAASLKTALDRIAADYTSETGIKVTISYAGSGLLARQIIEGAPADIYISANPGWMDQVEQAGMTVPDTRQDLLANRLVLIGHDDAGPVGIGPDLDLPALLDGGRLAMGMVDSVPAGQYGKAALETLGLWDDVAASVAQADNVRAALALVASGEAPMGIVYATDAQAEKRVHVLGQFPEGSHPPITYPAALLSGASDPADRAFFEALDEEDSAQIFAAEGFVTFD